MSSRTRVTDEQIAAAQLRIVLDEKLGRPTPDVVRRIAGMTRASAIGEDEPAQIYGFGAVPVQAEPSMAGPSGLPGLYTFVPPRAQWVWSHHLSPHSVRAFQNAQNELAEALKGSDQRSQAAALIELAQARLVVNDLTRAAIDFSKAMEISTAVHDSQLEMQALRGLATAAASMGNTETALVNFNAAAKIARRLDDQHGLHDALRGLAAELLKEGRVAEAGTAINELLADASEHEGERPSP